MAGWGTKSFENEDAANWLTKLGTTTAEDLTRILSGAADSRDYLEEPPASVAVAAAEVVAALHGAPAEGVPREIIEWTKKNPQASTPELKALALRALDRVQRNSELKDLWLEADGLNDWIAAMQDLQTRVGT